MEVLRLEKQRVVENQLMSLVAEIILDKAIRDYEIRRLYAQIDDTLAQRDHERFLMLTDELNLILKES
jgi:uncharacterized protein YpiB (UPF0302 family)